MKLEDIVFSHIEEDEKLRLKLHNLILDVVERHINSNEGILAEAVKAAFTDIAINEIKLSVKIAVREVVTDVVRKQLNGNGKRG